MVRVFSIILFPLLLAGCGTVFDPALLISASAKSLTAGFDQQRANEQVLIAELQRENESLSFLSRGQYECGDPRLLARLVKGDPAQLVKQDKVDKQFTAGEKVVGAYLKALNDIVTQTKSDLQTAEDIAGIAEAASVLGVAVGAASSFSAAVKSLKKLAATGITDAGLFEMRQVAKDMDPALQRAVAALKKHYPSFSANEKKLFRHWDQCAVEKLVFIRDIPANRVRGYENSGYFGSNSGTELDIAYRAYLDRRKQLKSTPIADALFDKVLSENKKLITLDFSPASLRAFAENIVSLNADIQSARKEVSGLLAD